MAPERDDPEREGDVTAAELALGVLEGEERAAALRRVLAEPAFAREVETWREHFGELFGQVPEAAAPEGVLPRLERSLEPRQATARYWPAVSAALGLIAASLLLVIVLRPPAEGPAVQPASPLVASLAPAQPGPALPAVYDPARGELRIPVSTTPQPQRSAELWVIGGDGVPHSLGLLNANQRTVIVVAPAARARLAAGAKLAVTSEPRGGAPNGLPTGPVIASGELFSS